MEKLVVEIELSKEEMEAVGAYIEKGCYDTSKLLKRLLLGAIEAKERRISQSSHHWDSRLRKAL